MAQQTDAILKEKNNTKTTSNNNCLLSSGLFFYDNGTRTSKGLAWPKLDAWLQELPFLLPCHRTDICRTWRRREWHRRSHLGCCLWCRSCGLILMLFLFPEHRPCWSGAAPTRTHLSIAVYKPRWDTFAPCAIVLQEKEAGFTASSCSALLFSSNSPCRSSRPKSTHTYGSAAFCEVILQAGLTLLSLA